MRRGARFPDDQAEVVFSDRFVEQLDDLSPDDAEAVLVQVVALCGDPSGKHPLRRVLAGWNTLDVLANRHRVVYKATTDGAGGLLEVLCLGPRRESEVYDMAAALVASGLLDEGEVTDLWDALGVLDVVAEEVGLDGWDFRPPPAPDSMQRTAVAAGIIDAETAALLSQGELVAAMEGAWQGEDGLPDMEAAIVAALERARNNARFPGRDVVHRRALPRCGKWMKRANASCIRQSGHPGACRAR